MEMKTHQALIRRVRVEDLAAINAIYNDYVLNSTATFQIEPLPDHARRAWFDDHRNEQYPVFVAEIGGELAGWASLSRYASRCAYRFTAEDSIYIACRHCRKGLGRLLLERLIDAAGAAGHHSIIAQISDHNTASIRLHESFGFKTTGELREVGCKFGRWLDITVMQRLVREES